MKRRPHTQKGLTLTEIRQMEYLYKVRIYALKKHMTVLPIKGSFFFFFFFFKIFFFNT
jgi:hypothetical protein